jgi:hypothetical protein
MRLQNLLFRYIFFAASLCFALSCQSPTSFPNGFEYLKAKGFEYPLFAQIRVGNTAKNVNDQIPSLFAVLRNSEMSARVKLVPAFTIYLETGSSLPSQIILILVDSDGSGEIRFNGQRAYFHCHELPAFANEIFQGSSIIVH